MTCVTWTEEEGQCQWSKCLPDCFCGLGHRNGVNEAGDAYTYEPMECGDDGDYTTQDGCRADLESNTEAHNECLEDNAGCDPGDYCMFYPSLDVGWLYGMPLGTILVNSY